MSGEFERACIDLHSFLWQNGPQGPWPSSADFIEYAANLLREAGLDDPK